MSSMNEVALADLDRINEALRQTRDAILSRRFADSDAAQLKELGESVIGVADYWKNILEPLSQSWGFLEEASKALGNGKPATKYMMLLRRNAAIFAGMQSAESSRSQRRKSNGWANWEGLCRGLFNCSNDLHSITCSILLAQASFPPTWFCDLREEFIDLFPAQILRYSRSLTKDWMLRIPHEVATTVAHRIKTIQNSKCVRHKKQESSSAATKSTDPQLIDTLPFDTIPWQEQPSFEGSSSVYTNELELPIEIPPQQNDWTYIQQPQISTGDIAVDPAYWSTGTTNWKYMENSS